MKKTLPYLLLMLVSVGIYAQQEQKSDTLTRQELKEILLSNNILGSKFEVKNRTGSAYYISPQDLEQFEYTDVNKVLRAVPGISIYEEDGFGLRPNISLRGTSPERSARITLMEDGVLIAPAPYSASSAYYFPTIGRMQAVEVLKGSSQIQYGPYTTGGAINMISKEIPNSFSGNARFTIGNYNTRTVEANVGDSYENFGWNTEYYNYNSDGFKSLDGGGNTGFDKSDYVGKFRWNTSAENKTFQAITAKIQYSEETSNETYLGLTDTDFDIDPFRRYAASQEDQMNADHSQFQLNHLLKLQSGFKLNTTIYRNNFKRNWYKLDNVQLENTVSISNVLADPLTYEAEYRSLLGTTDTPNDAFGVKANNRKYYAQGIQTIGTFLWGSKNLQTLELGLRFHQDEEDRFQWEDRYAIQNGEMIRTTVAEKGTDANRIASADALAAHVLYKITLGDLTLTPGLRYENITLKRKDYGTNDTARTGIDLSTRENKVDVWIPGIGANYKLAQNLSFFGGVHKGFAPPGSSEGQKPEESINFELGSRFFLGGFNGEIVGFYNDYSNLLGSDLAASGGTGTLDQFNAGAVTVNGLELLLNYNILQNTGSSLQLPITFAYTLTNSEFNSSFESSDAIYGDVTDGDEIPYIARNQFNITASLDHKSFNISLSGRYTDAFRTQAGSGSIPEQFKVPSNFIVDFATRYYVSKNVTLSGNINNLFDTTYAVSRVPSGLRPGMPFSINTGIAYKF
ncbi:TonB-dependent receptor family protein [Leeuwenhoekiella sp. MAR_2009_132]|uniref:TonB-dependent receptor family protein n=1 Tax=Leeuwenhoekiella sp. MAR_2009_132 TaxID=1392489 RepID=UPI00048CDC4C|nr:TonB-dependent receptor [Leeuwenhoekiella sp. MAR_2009_132]